MAKVDLDHIRHAYGPARTEDDYALREVHYAFEVGVR